MDNNDIISRYLYEEIIDDMDGVANKSDENADERPEWLDIVCRHVGSLRYGVVQIVVHDSQVTQIEKTERVRLATPRAQTE